MSRSCGGLLGCPVSDPLDRLEQWNRECRARFEAGRKVYGDSTFRRDAIAVIDEGLDELRDAQNYVFAVSHVLLEIRNRLAAELGETRPAS